MGVKVAVTFVNAVIADVIAVPLFGYPEAFGQRQNPVFPLKGRFLQGRPFFVPACCITDELKKRVLLENHPISAGRAFMSFYEAASFPRRLSRPVKRETDSKAVLFQKICKLLGTWLWHEYSHAR